MSAYDYRTPWAMSPQDTVIFSQDGRTRSHAVAATRVGRVEERYDSFTFESTFVNADTIRTGVAIAYCHLHYFAIQDPAGVQRTPWTPLRSAIKLYAGDTMIFQAGELRCKLSERERMQFEKGTLPRNWDNMTYEEQKRRYERYKDGSGPFAAYPTSRRREEPYQAPNPPKRGVSNYYHRQQKTNEFADQIMRAFSNADAATIRKALEEKLAANPVGLSPKDQSLINTLENGHVTLAQFQAKHGLEADGIWGPATEKLVRDLEYKRLNNQAVEKLVMGSHAIETQYACPYTASFVRTGTSVAGMHCDNRTPKHQSHGATYLGYRVSWVEPESTFWKEGPHKGMWLRMSEPAFRQHQSGASMAIDMLRSEYAPPITKPKNFVKLVEPRFASEKEFRKHVMQMSFTISRNAFIGWNVEVDMERGTWHFWRPTEPWAERVGSKKLLREIDRMTHAHGFQERRTITAVRLGVQTTDELTEELRQTDAEASKSALTEWDAEFSKAALSTPAKEQITLREVK